MSSTWKLILVLVICVIVPFAIWGEQIEAWATVEPGSGTLAGQSRWAWAVGIGLLIADLLIPIPTTSIIAGLGMIYGPVVGAGVAIAGSMLSAFIGYACGRWLGRPLVQRVFGASLDRGEAVFERHGGWIVATSRWLPVLPEVVSVVAGAHKMPLANFLLAALCGAVPFALAFSAIGHVGVDYPLATLLISALVPLVLWFVLSRSGLLPRVKPSAD